MCCPVHAKKNKIQNYCSKLAETYVHLIYKKRAYRKTVPSSANFTMFPSSRSTTNPLKLEKMSFEKRDKRLYVFIMHIIQYFVYI